MTYGSTTTVTELARRIADASTIVCTSHAKPDGDAMGSVIGLVRALSPRCTAEGWLLGAVPDPIRSIAGETPWVHIRTADDIPDDEPDLILVLDTGAWSQLNPLQDWLRARHDRVLGLDHHASGDDVAAHRVVDVTAASCTMVVLDLIDALGIALNTDVAEPLFAGLATDTGWFRQANADANAFSAAARLLAQGVNKARLYREIEETAPPTRLAIQARALSSVSWHHDDLVALMRLTREDFAETGARRSEVTGLVNAPLVVGRTEVGVLLLEEKEGGVKVSLRSKPPRATGGSFIDVASVAGTLGGGGHVHAAGAVFDGTIDAAGEAVLVALEAALHPA